MSSNGRRSIHKEVGPSKMACELGTSVLLSQSIGETIPALSDRGEVSPIFAPKPNFEGSIFLMLVGLGGMRSSISDSWEVPTSSFAGERPGVDDREARCFFLGVAGTITLADCSSHCEDSTSSVWELPDDDERDKGIAGTLKASSAGVFGKAGSPAT